MTLSGLEVVFCVQEKGGRSRVMHKHGVPKSELIFSVSDRGLTKHNPQEIPFPIISECLNSCAECTHLR